MTIIIQDDDGFISGTVTDDLFRGSFDSLCRAYEILGKQIDAAEYEAGSQPADYQQP